MTASRPIQPSASPNQNLPPVSTNQRTRYLTETALHQNPFWLLGVTSRDDRRRIVELAEEKSLELDHDACQKARSDLTNPRIRLAIEMAWLPGISPRKATQLASKILHDPMSVRIETGLPTLAHANLMAAAFESVDDKDDLDDIAEFIHEISYLVDELSAFEVIRDINEDRAVSQFPEVMSNDLVEAELAERKRYYRNAIKEGLNRLSPSSLVEVMTMVVDYATENGETHSPELIDELVDSYAMETQAFLQEEAENVHKLINSARDSAISGEGAVKLLVDKLEIVSRNWDKVAQPIQLSAKARGINHEQSEQLAYSMRSLAIELFNEHDMLTQSKRITNLLQELFAELPEVIEVVEKDVDALDDIFQNRKQAEARRSQWEKEITYSTEIGLMFKDTLSITPNEVTWKNQRFPLESITRVRWGGVRNSVNGIPTGTTYTIAFGDKRSEAIVELKRSEVYSTFIDKFWRAVCVRLLTELLTSLKDGYEIRCGEAMLRDDGITLMKHKFFGSDDPVRCSWYETHIWDADGSFYIGHKDDKKTYVALSYIQTSNVHIVEQAIRMAFKKPGMQRLSDLLE
jgi:hypothetical protein